MPRIIIDNIILDIPATFDQFPVKAKEKLLVLLSKHNNRDLIYSKFTAVMFYYCAVSRNFWHKIRLFFLIYTARDIVLMHITEELKPFLDLILSDITLKAPPYAWVKPMDELTFYEFRQAIGQLHKYYSTQKLEHLINFCSFMSYNKMPPQDFEPTLVLIYFNSMMDLFAEAFPNLFTKSEEKPEGNPWATALKQISRSPHNMEQNDSTGCLTCFQWMEDSIIENLKRQAAHDNGN